MTWVPTIMMLLAGVYMGYLDVPVHVWLVGVFTYVAGVIRGELA